MLLRHNSSSLASLPEPGTVRIKVVGVGGGGVNAVRRMGHETLLAADLLCVNTDAASLQAAHGVKTIMLGARSTKGQGAGGNPDMGRRAAEEARDLLLAEFRGYDLVFIAAGMGGGTGTGAAPVVAAAARAAGATTVGVMTTPFQFEGTKRKLAALKGILPLQDALDTLILVNNQQLTSIVSRHTSIQAAFALADQVIVQAIASVSRIITTPGEVNIDFADVRAVLRHGGLGLMGIASAGGNRRIIDALKAALADPLVDLRPEGAKGVLYFITAGPDVTLGEVADAGSYVAGIVDPDAQIFFGLNTDPTREPGADVEVVIIANRLPQNAWGNGPSRQASPITSLFRADSERPPFPTFS